jgi:hypothetical protein
VSPEIASVIVVEWSLDGSTPAAAFIEFGASTEYGHVAPVDIDEAGGSFRTLLLGMTPLTEVHFRIVARSGDDECVSQDFSELTGPVLNGFPVPSVETSLPELASDGFIVTSRFVGGRGEGTGQVYIMNGQGQLVWWYAPPTELISRARLAYDGHSLFLREVNVQGVDSRIHQVSMDGLELETIELPGSHHDFTLTPDGGLVFIRKTEDSCDEIVKRSRDGELQVLFAVIDAFPELPPADRDRCHTNYVVYDAADDSYTFSELNNDAIVKITSQGELVWVLGGGYSDFAGASWNRQHGHQLLDGDRIVLFNNGDADYAEPSIVREFALDFEAMTATETWSYDSGFISTALGDVQRLTNGNTFVVYSTAGVMQEVTPEGALARDIRFALGEGPGYADFRPTLYGPPPR